MLDDTGYGPSPRRRGSGNMLTHTIMAVLGAALATGLLLAFYNPGSGGSGISLPGSGAVPAPAPAAPLAGGEQAIVTKVKPGLVIINTALQYNSEAAAGTGMVINADGLVLTNNHVIDDSTKITATVAATGRTYPATVVGYDKTGDIALIQLQNASGLTTVPIGNSSSVKVGNAVVALGNAEGRGSITATAGEVTGLNQTITASEEGSSTASETLSGMIQTDADIVPGDSGGPLASSAGVIGMDTAGNDVSDQQQASAGFAIPINTALSVARQIAGGHASSTITIGYPPFVGIFIGSGSSSSPQAQAQQEEQQRRRLRRLREQPGLLHQQCRPDRAVGHRARQFRHPDRRDDLREPRCLGGHDRRSGHYDGEWAGRRLARRLDRHLVAVPSGRHDLRHLG